MKVLLSLFYAFGVIAFILGLQSLLFFPLTLVYEVWKLRFFKKREKNFTPSISVIVPAFNEENTIRGCVESILRSKYPQFEVIVVNDGSTDRTEEAIRDLINSQEIIYIKKQNQGKASALNKGIEFARGEIIVYTDADTIFLSDTLRNLARWFIDPKVHAVCGNDTPVSPKTPIQKLLVITTHIGTGFVRRALSIISSLHIVTGNLGAVRKETIKSLGGFIQIWGEDLEFTFRLQKARKKIVYDSSPMVLAECPNNLKSLWRQRVRWLRSYIKVCIIHKDLFFNPKYAPFSFYLPLNFISLIIVPLLQLFTFIILPFLLKSENLTFNNPWNILAYTGLIFFFAISTYSCILDKSFKDLRFLIPYGFLILPLSYFYNFVVIYSLFKEISKAEEKWEKIERKKISEIWTPKKSLTIAFVSIFLVLIVSIFIYFIYTSNKALHTPMKISSKSIFAISTHFDAWEDWRKAINSVLNSPGKKFINLIGVGAGRAEWTYFKWKGHKQNWSNHQKGTNQDLLLQAIKYFHKEGWPVIAIVDFYAPKYIQKYPEKAALRFDGRKSLKQVCFIELVKGEYGELMLEMIEYLAKQYPIKAINLTELNYYSYCYDNKCLKFYSNFTGRRDWPRHWLTRKILREHPSIGKWRSYMMSKFIEKVANIVHKYGKEIYVDVPVSWNNFKNNAKEYGLDYNLILASADKIIIWNYFYLKGRKPEISLQLSRYLRRNFNSEKIIISIGLWGKKEYISPKEIAIAVFQTLKGGTNNLWITPNHLLSRDHWIEIREVFNFTSEKFSSRF
ncbi:glycosyltransferase family 2 protein [Candidatus Aminicenantes bacterium AH-873-B07]|jgi:cellulose synthase/poly-beta-1,6-N-acetylglucosamine synthase-like glycosyltransferase|nr:glycosyltransferase family 2 protein [Candidatus Aminicenantes bacterium AH-873-B07]